MTDVNLPDGDYILSEGAGWFTVGMFSVRIKQTSEGVEVHIFPADKEDDDSIASCTAFASDVREDPLDAQEEGVMKKVWQK